MTEKENNALKSERSFERQDRAAQVGSLLERQKLLNAELVMERETRDDEQQMMMMMMGKRIRELEQEDQENQENAEQLQAVIVDFAKRIDELEQEKQLQAIIVDNLTRQREVEQKSLSKELLEARTALQRLQVIIVDLTHRCKVEEEASSKHNESRTDLQSQLDVLSKRNQEVTEQLRASNLNLSRRLGVEQEARSKERGYVAIIVVLVVLYVVSMAVCVKRAWVEKIRRLFQVTEAYRKNSVKELVLSGQGDVGVKEEAETVGRLDPERFDEMLGNAKVVQEVIVEDILEHMETDGKERAEIRDL